MISGNRFSSKIYTSYRYIKMGYYPIDSMSIYGFAKFSVYSKSVSHPVGSFANNLLSFSGKSDNYDWVLQKCSI